MKKNFCIIFIFLFYTHSGISQVIKIYPNKKKTSIGKRLLNNNIYLTTLDTILKQNKKFIAIADKKARCVFLLEKSELGLIKKIGERGGGLFSLKELMTFI